MPYKKKNRSIGGGNRLENVKKKRDDAYKAAARKSVEMGADSPFDMGYGEDTPEYKKYERLDKKYKKKKGPFAGSTSKGSARNNY
jgi:hypothetical protein